MPAIVFAIIDGSRRVSRPDRREVSHQGLRLSRSHPVLIRRHYAMGSRRPMAIWAHRFSAGVRNPMSIGCQRMARAIIQVQTAPKASWLTGGAVVQDPSGHM